MWNDDVDDLALGLEELTLLGGWRAKDWGMAGIEALRPLGCTARSVRASVMATALIRHPPLSLGRPFHLGAGLPGVPSCTKGPGKLAKKAGKELRGCISYSWQCNSGVNPTGDFTAVVCLMIWYATRLKLPPRWTLIFHYKAPSNIIHACTAQDLQASYHKAVPASEMVKHPFLSSNPTSQRKIFQPTSTKKKSPRNTTQDSRPTKLNREEAVDSASTMVSGSGVVSVGSIVPAMAEEDR
ncbi:hypothetical protein P691DRAFT_783171 [Macrolepiota fuliginosa MF-IS2]|uniref:Uncharacterized protein n=1 Tax=Macrolepiota fuliginosa MF-IS2 TaxID=1400762 RepID=A0A9P6BW77_9AGAR|nr:hypothetical protein P691DRAFT_783171 [Macrolepiota fuliginosa MF-IS2]